MIFQNWKEGENRVILNKVTSQVTRGMCCSVQHINPSRSEPQPSCVLPRLCASEVVCRETGWGSRRHSVPPLSSSNLQLQCYTCPTSSGNAGMPFQGLFPKGIQIKKSDKFRLKNPCMGSGTQLGCFQTLVLSSRRKEFDSHIILFISNRSILAFLIFRLTKPMQRKFSPLI